MGAIDVRLDAFRAGLSWFQPYAAKLSLVTVCRSVRDGYTPRRSWQAIETGVLRALGGKATFDPNLLGGERGWAAWTERSLDRAVWWLQRQCQPTHAHVGPDWSTLLT